MERILGLAGFAWALVGAIVALPAHTLTSFMDDVDEVWLLDPFLD